MLFIAKTKVASSSWPWRISIDALVIGVIENEEDEERVLLSLNSRKSPNPGVHIAGRGRYVHFAIVDGAIEA
jgi:hypothetical protein